jgi:hypothetical protein
MEFIMSENYSVQVETFEGGKGSHRSLKPIFNCTIENVSTFEEWGHNNTWGPYGRHLEVVQFVDPQQPMLWLDVYEPVVRDTVITVEFAWVDGVDGSIHRGCLYPDGYWSSNSSMKSPPGGIDWIKAKVKEIRPHFFD